MKNRLEPSEIGIAEALRKFADVEIYETANRLAERTLTRPVCPSQLLDGLSTLFGGAAGRWLWRTLEHFDSAAFENIAERYLEPTARRNAALFIARWAPVMETFVNGDRLQSLGATLLLEDDDASETIELHLRTYSGDKLRAKVNTAVARAVCAQILGALQKADALPPQIGADSIESLRIKKTGAGDGEG